MLASQRALPAAVALLLALCALPACQHSQQQSTSGQPALPTTSTPSTGSTPAAGGATADSGATKRVAVVFGATENDPWTGAMLAEIANACGVDPLSKGTTESGLDAFGPYDVKLKGHPVELHVALCDFSGTADIQAQQKLGELARKWVTDLKPDVVWLDSDPVQLNVGSQLDPALPIVYSGVEVESDVYYDAARAACGVARKPSLTRAMGELWKVAPNATHVALVCDDSALGLSRVTEIRALEPALPKGTTFVTQPPVKTWAELHKLLAGLDKGIDGVIVTAMGAHGSRILESGKPCPADLLKGVKPPVLTLGPTSMDNSGALSLRIKPDAHAQAVITMLGKVLDGTKPSAIPTEIPDDMELFKNER